MSYLQEKYNREIRPQLRTAGGYRNVFEVPRLEKVVVNICVGTRHDRDALNEASEELARITGQKPATTLARKSVSNFKLREGMPLGAKVTLRGRRMYDFLERLINVALPRIRDFRGIGDRSFDGRGNFSLGIREHTIFPELDPNQVKRTQGMDITIVTSARTDEEARGLLKAIGMPFAGNS
jgi:large subunit ribosomal protein L5